MERKGNEKPEQRNLTKMSWSIRDGLGVVNGDGLGVVNAERGERTACVSQRADSMCKDHVASWRLRLLIIVVGMEQGLGHTAHVLSFCYSRARGKPSVLSRVGDMSG